MKQALKNKLVDFALGCATLLITFGGATLLMLLLITWLF